ncbi:g2461 [Coccomyxa elongata]
MPVTVPPLNIQLPGEEGVTPLLRDTSAFVKPRWAESWSQSPSLQSSMNESQAFQPLRTSVPGEREFEADVSRRTTEDSVYSQATARTHVNSPHAAAASRRFLASSTTSFRGIGDTRGIHAGVAARTFPGRYAAVDQSMAPPLEHGVRISSTQAEMKDEDAAAAAPGRTMQENLAAKLPAGLTDDSERDDVRPSARWSIPAAPNPCGGEAVKMGRHEAWARFLAYEAAMQICLRVSREGHQFAEHFLESGCAVLRRAYAFEGLLLQPVHPGSAPCGATLVWDDSEAAVLPTVGFGPTVTRESTVRCMAERLQSTSLYRPARGGRPGGLPELYISLRPSQWQQGGSWTKVAPDGKGSTNDVVELTRDDMSDDLLVEVTTESGERVAHGTIPIADVWGGAGSQFSVEQPPPVERRRWPCLPCWRAGSSGQSDIFGKKWITLLDVTDARYGHVLLSAWISNTEKTVITAAEISPGTAGRVQETNTGALPKNYEQITGWEVYNLSLHAALEAQGCGPRQLEVKGEWAWLLEEFAATYGIRSSYTVLAHLLWAIRRENATVTAYCFSMLNSKLVGLKQEEVDGCLLPQEKPLLERIQVACEDLLARCLENYYSLSENAPSGISENGMDTSEQPAPALMEAVLLCRTVSDVLHPSEAGWFTERFQIAAVKRYARLQAACTEQIYSAEARARAHRATADGNRNHARTTGPLQQTAPAFNPPAPGGSEAEMAYKRLQAICAAMRQELDSDLRIHETRKLPNWIILPQITAAEYGKLFVVDLMAALEQHPPPQPSQQAVDLLVSVGQQQKYLDANGLLPPAGHPGDLDAFQVFGHHVTRWINGSKAGLCARCRQIESTTMASAVHPDRITEDGKSCVAPLVEEMLQRIGGEVARYERVIAYWHVFGPLLEGAVCASLRETTGAVTRQCGLSQVRGDEQRYNGHAPPGVHPRTTPKFASDDRSPSRWKWNATVAAVGQARLTVLPHEAVLLNSLRKLLSVVPQTEHTIAKWAGGVAAAPPTPSSSAPPGSPLRQGAREPTGLGTERMPSGSDGPELGAQFAQLVKELRSEYAGAVTACAARIAQGVFGPSGRSILRILEQHGITGTPTLMQQQVGPVLEAMEEVILGLTRTLDGRVYVALGRGLWDFTAKEIFDYVESLQEGKESQGAWRGRQNAAAALDVVDNFFCTILSSTLQDALQAKDLDLPLHSDRAHKLLAANTAAINMSYTVY